MLSTQLRPPDEDLLAFERRFVRPATVIEGTSRRYDGAIDIGFRGEGDLGDHRPVDGTDDRVTTARAVNPRAVNEQAGRMGDMCSEGLPIDDGHGDPFFIRFVSTNLG